MKDTTHRFVADLIVGRATGSAVRSWRQVDEVLTRYRLSGLALGVTAGCRAVPQKLRLRWEAAHRVQAVAALLLDEEWGHVRAVLAAEGIPASLVKGAWMNSRGYYRPGERALDDIDVVVPRSAASAAVRILEASGWRPWDPDPGATVQWAGATTFHPRGPARLAGLAVDLHAGVDYGALRASTRSRAGEEVTPGLDDPATQLVTTVEHFLKHWRCKTHLVGLVDMARLLQEPLDLERAMGRLRAGPWGPAGPALLAGLATRMGGEAEERVGQAVPDGSRRPFLPDCIVARAGRRPGRLSGVGGRWLLRGPSAAVRECADVLFPPTSWLLSRYGDGTGRAGARLAHLGRMVGWALGATPSPLSPNQD